MGNQQDFASAAQGNRLCHIWLHEFGHAIVSPTTTIGTLGAPPAARAWQGAPSVEAPRCVMNAGAASTVTDWDKWMLERAWSELLRGGRWD